MENFFKNDSVNKPKETKPEEVSLSMEEYEKILKEAEEWMQKQVNVSEEDIVLFIAGLESRHMSKREAEIYKKEVQNIKKKYEAKRKSLIETMGRLTSKILKASIKTVSMVAIFAHLFSKEYPDMTLEQKNNEPVEWNAETKEEINALAEEYVFDYRRFNKDEDVEDEVLKKRFVDFVSEYGGDIKVVHAGEEKAIEDKVVQYVFSDILQNRTENAHYFVKTLYYKGGEPREGDRSPRIDDFIPELSHHINEDNTPRRMLEYVDDWVIGGFNQGDMYDDVYTPEYQAHTITESAIRSYLYAKKDQMKFTFAEKYNLYQEYYRGILDNKRDYESEEQITNIFYYNVIEKDDDFLSLKQDKEKILEQVELLRRIVDTQAGRLDKVHVSEMYDLVSFYITTSSSKYGISPEKYAETVTDMILFREKAISDDAAFFSAADEIGAVFKSDEDYNYTSLTKLIFNRGFVQKIELLEAKDSEYKFRLYELQEYGLIKSAEGKALGRDYCAGDFDGVLEVIIDHYGVIYDAKENLDSHNVDENSGATVKVKQLLKRSEYRSNITRLLGEYFGDEDNAVKVSLMEYTTSRLSYDLEFDADTDDGIEYVYFEDQTGFYIAQRIIKNLEENSDVNPERDYLVDGKSPLTYKMFLDK